MLAHAGKPTPPPGQTPALAAPPDQPVPSSGTGAAEGAAMGTLPQRLLLISLDEDGKLRDPNSSLANGLAGRP
jgi:hypothetical protein